MLIIMVFAGCKTLEEAGISEELFGTTIAETAKAFRPISDEEEYYVGRAVAARILSSYPLLKDKKLTDYVNLVGQTVALHSDKPFTYNGYHFAVLDSGEINAFACPGGTIFITKGMINAVKNEDELAAVLAHEVAHINHRDGIASIKKARWTEALTIIGTSAAKQYGKQELANLVSIFEESIEDVVKTLVVNGYARTQESAADKAAIIYLSRAGYNPEALRDFINALIIQGRASGGGMLKTHPATTERLREVEGSLGSVRVDISALQARTKRFRESIR